MRNASLLLLLIGSLSACSGEAPEEAYFDREGPPKRSDTLVAVLANAIDSIQSTPLTGDRDVDQVTEMILHHRATIQLNEILIGQGNDEELKDFARDLNTTQRKEIKQMKAFLYSHPPVSGRGKRGRPQVLMGLEKFEPSDDLDAAYVHLMRMHLNDAIRLAQEEAERGLHDDMQEIARGIVASTEKALDELDRIGEGP